MSGSTATARAPRPDSRTARTARTATPHGLRVVAPRRLPRASSGTFVLVVGGLLSLGLLGLLALNTLLAQGSFATHELAQERALLTVREQALQQEVAVLESPQELARRAVELGMVASDNPVFLDLRTNRILGTPKPGYRPPAVVRATSRAAAATAPRAATKPPAAKPAAKP